ncbi:hypothetical protein ACFU7X_44880 [Streptomyces chartreusis]|uniref:hypothetical protein n=1 Tax=Streptomyces chartreusis TaxID=1969 RepID=UPI00368999C1
MKREEAVALVQRILDGHYDGAGELDDWLVRLDKALRGQYCAGQSECAARHRDALENHRGSDVTVGSNPTPTAHANGP